MENQKQVEMIKKALMLETKIASYSQMLSNLLSEQFYSTPNPPKRNLIERTYPQIMPQTKFNWMLAILPAIPLLICGVVGGIAWIAIYYFVIFKKQQEKEIMQIQNSTEYRNHCKAADIEFDKKQIEADILFQKQCEVYEIEILPKYQKELEEWTARHNEKVHETESNLRSAEEALKKHYETTKIVPLQYRTIEILQYLYNLMSTSDYDVKAAIDLYDRNEQRKLDEARLYEQQQANEYAAYQNQLVEEQNYIAEKQRRDANIAAAVGTVQRHNTNKAL